MTNVESLETLGVIFNEKGNSKDHVETRIRKCRSAFYSHAENGLYYPGLLSEVKAYLWRICCAPVLTFGCDVLHLNVGDLDKLETLQGNLLKQSLGLSRRSHSTDLLQALGVPKIKEVILTKQFSLLKRMMHTKSPNQRFYSSLLSKYILTGEYCCHTLIGRIIDAGYSPILVASTKGSVRPVKQIKNGIADTIRTCIFNASYNNPMSIERSIVKLLVQV